MEKTKKSQTEGKKMIDDFMHVLEDYTNANLHSVAARKRIAEALVQHMCDHHIVTFTNYETAVNDPCLLYTSPSPRDRQKSRMPSSA